MNVAILVAGGTGERLGVAGGKQLAGVAGRPLLSFTAAALAAAELIDRVVLVAHPDRVDEYADIVRDALDRTPLHAAVAGGETRSASVRAGLAALPGPTSIVVIHDGARPLIDGSMIDAAVEALEVDQRLDGVVVGHPCYDTLKIVTADALVVGTADRSVFWLAQTPQVFRPQALREAYERSRELGYEGTDDASLVERAGGRVRMIAGPRTNLKVTVPEDLAVLDAVLAARGGGVTS